MSGLMGSVSRTFLDGAFSHCRPFCVAQVSGNFMCNTDNETRLKNHYSGKMYRGWKMVRDKLAELKAKNPPRVNIRDR